MSIRIVRLGSSRGANEGPRLGTVRRPPRGVPKSEFASHDYYDQWLPLLSPSATLISEAKAAADPKAWAAFERKFRREMKSPAASQLLDVLALLSHGGNFSLGCYCDDEQHCHRSVLKKLIEGAG